MRGDIIELVKALTLTDTKTLTQKALKLSEECGEMAKHVLPYENAAGTLHRVVHKGHILEEAVDSMLVALSIAYSLGFDDNDIASVMQKKALYWAQLQDNQKADPNRIPFEIHVTVDASESVEKFRVDCNKIGVKPVLLDLHTKKEGLVKDMMTSQVVIGSTAEAFSAMNATSAALGEIGYDVIRRKIEAAPWHPSAPTATNGLKHIEDNYFESHLEVYVENTEGANYSVKTLKEILQGSDVHVSSNAFKVFGDVSTVMVTLRRKVGIIQSFTHELVVLRKRLLEAGFKISEKDIVEYSIFDSNVQHDSAWIGSRG